MTITIDDQISKAIQMIHDRYYFGLFETIVKSEDEEYEIRDAIDKLAQIIEEKKMKKEKRQLELNEFRYTIGM